MEVNFRAIASAARSPKIPVSLLAAHLQGSNSLVVHVEVQPTLSGAKPVSGQLLLASADDSDQSNVRRVENAGRTLRHVAVVRTLTQVGTVERIQGFSKDVTVSVGNAALRNLSIMAVMQDGSSGRVLGVGATRLSG